jgi:type I restriction enzyme M protein
MTQVQLQQLQKHLWNIANDLRGKMGADEFRDYILGFIFYKYLSEKAISFANELLKDEGLAEKYYQLDENNPDHAELIDGIKENSVEEVGYALAPNNCSTQLLNVVVRVSLFLMSFQIPCEKSNAVL